MRKAEKEQTESRLEKIRTMGGSEIKTIRNSMAKLTSNLQQCRESSRRIS